MSDKAYKVLVWGAAGVAFSLVLELRDYAPNIAVRALIAGLGAGVIVFMAIMAMRHRST